MKTSLKTNLHQVAKEMIEDLPVSRLTFYLLLNLHSRSRLPKIFFKKFFRLKNVSRSNSNSNVILRFTTSRKSVIFRSKSDFKISVIIMRTNEILELKVSIFKFIIMVFETCSDKG